MAALGTYIASYLFYFLILGMALHIIDRAVGVPFYRWWYNRSRPDRQMPQTVEMGFMYNQSFHRKRNWALVISAVQSVYMVLTKGIDPFVEVIVFAFESVVMLVGFAWGAYAFKLIQKQEAIAEATDRFGSELERDAKGFVLGSIRHAFGTLLARVRSQPTVAKPKTATPPTATTTTTVAQEESNAQAPPAKDWRERLDRLDKKGV